MRDKNHIFWSSHNLFRHLTCSGCFFHPSVSIRPLSCLHHTVYKPSTTPTSNTYSFRWLHSIHVGSFLTDLKSSQLITDSPNPKSLGSLLSAYNTALSALLSSRSVTAKSILTKFRTSAPWWDVVIYLAGHLNWLRSFGGVGVRKLASRIDLALASNTGYCATAHTRDYYSIHMRFEKRCYFDVRSKSYMSQIDLQQGTNC